MILLALAAAVAAPLQGSAASGVSLQRAEGEPEPSAGGRWSIPARIEVDPTLPETALRLELARGAATDPPGRPGLAHLVEHLLVSGEPYETSLEGRMFSIGGRVSAWTTHDAIVLTLVAPPGRLPTMGEALAGVLVRPPVTEAEVGRVRAVVRREWETTPELDLRAALWPGHPYGQPVLAVGLDDLAAGDVDAALRRAIDLTGALLVVVGPDAAVPAPFLAAEPIREEPAPADRPVRQVIRPGVVAWSLPPPDDQGAAGWEIVAELLSERGWPTTFAQGRLGAVLTSRVSDSSLLKKGIVRMSHGRVSARTVERARGRVAARRRTVALDAAARAEALAMCVRGVRCPEGTPPTVDDLRGLLARLVPQ